MKNLVRWRTNALALHEVSMGGRRSSQLPLEHYIANERALTSVMLTIVILFDICNMFLKKGNIILKMTLIFFLFN
jgi:hypothetical protein